MDILPKVAHTCSKYGLLDPGDRVVLGLSGGPDSIAMLSVLTRMRSDWNLSLAAVHLNHMFRGDQADADMEFCRRVSAELDVPFFGFRRDVSKYSYEQGLNKQDAGRRLRYQLFREVSSQTESNRIAVAHHRNDVVETFFMRLLRGAGPQGLSSIPPKRGRVIRPLYEVSRREIEEYCEERGLSYRTDPSNYSTQYFRNKVRLELLPLLEEQFAPTLLDTVARTVEIIRDESELVDAVAEGLWDQVARQASQGSGVLVSISELMAMPLALRRRTLQNAYLRAGRSHYQLSFQRIQDLIALVEQNSGSLDLPGGLRATVDGEMLVFDHEIGGATPGKKADLGVRNLSSGTNHLTDWGLRIDIDPVESLPPPGSLPDRLEHPGEIWQKDGRWEIWLDRDAIDGPLICRTRKPGDRFIPLGMKGRKKLKDYFIDKKVPVEDRDEVPLLCDGQGIVAVVGYQQAERTRLTSESTRALRVRVVRDSV